MSSTRGRGAGSRSVTVNKRRRKSRKKLCDLGTSCPYQHEYQHQLEFTHDGSAIPSSSGRLGRVGGGGGGGEAVGGRGARRGRGRERERGGGRTESTISALNGTGTGARGRLLAVAADRRRAERSLQQGAGQDLLNIHGGDAREAQRTRWVMRMQNEVHQQAPEPERPRAASSRPARAGGGSSPSSSSDEVQLLPSSSLARPSSSSASPSPSICHLRSESEPLGTGRSNTVGIKRATPNPGNSPTTRPGVVHEVVDLC